MSKVILITGASSGLGREATLLLGKQGHTVYAGARRMDRMADLTDYGVIAVEMVRRRGLRVHAALRLPPTDAPESSQVIDPGR